MTLRVVIVDDEPLARRRLARLLDRVGGAELVGEAADVDAAAAAIRATDPDVVLLDIRMPGGDGVTLARTLPARPVVIFTTAHADHAVDAFDAAAVDYLLKPVEAERLTRALARAQGRLATAVAEPDRLATLLAPAPPRLTARRGDVVRILDALAIARFRAEDKYTVAIVDGEEHLLDESLATLADRLGAHGFVRIHRAELVRLERVRALHLDGDLAEVELDDGQRARVSRRLLPALRRRLDL